MSESSNNSSVHSDPKGTSFWSWPAFLAITAILAVIIVLVIKAHSAQQNSLLMARQLYEYSTFRLAAASGWNIWLVRAITVLSLIPLWYYSLRILARPTVLINWRPERKRERDHALMILAAYLAIFFFAMYAANPIFENGKSTKWINQRTGQLFDFPGADPRTGEALVPVTSEIAIRIDRKAKKNVPKLLSISFSANGPSVEMFDSLTGSPAVWFCRGLNGDIRFFDADGLDPATGDKLLPVTKEIVEEAGNSYKNEMSSRPQMLVPASPDTNTANANPVKYIAKWSCMPGEMFDGVTESDPMDTDIVRQDESTLWFNVHYEEYGSPEISRVYLTKDRGDNTWKGTWSQNNPPRDGKVVVKETTKGHWTGIMSGVNGQQFLYTIEPAR